MPDPAATSDTPFADLFGEQRSTNPQRAARENAPIAAGSPIRFTYRAEDWDWLESTFGPLGPYIPPDGVAAADGETGRVLSFCDGPRSGRGPDGPWVNVLLHRPLGWSAYEEYGPDELAALGLDPEGAWPTEFMCPLSCLSSWF